MSPKGCLPTHTEVLHCANSTALIGAECDASLGTAAPGAAATSDGIRSLPAWLDALTGARDSAATLVEATEELPLDSLGSDAESESVKTLPDVMLEQLRLPPSGSEEESMLVPSRLSSWVHNVRPSPACVGANAARGMPEPSGGRTLRNLLCALEMESQASISSSSGTLAWGSDRATLQQDCSCGAVAAGGDLSSATETWCGSNASNTSRIAFMQLSVARSDRS